MRTGIFTLLALLATPLLAHAAAWPDDWLGPPDNRYVNLRLGVFYYGAVLDDLPDANGVSPLPLGGTAPDGTPLPKTKGAWLARLNEQQDEGTRQADMNIVRGQLESTAQFYWRNTRFNCALTFDYVNQDAAEASQPILRSSIEQADAPYYTPLPFTRDDKLRVDPRYDGLLQIVVLYRYDGKTGGLERVAGGGGFTEGAELPPVGPHVDAAADAPSRVPTQKLCGYSWWIAPPADNVCGSDWLLCHEFGHQLDSLFEQSGHPEFWFNHLARSEANIARFGEHFDCMAYILRRVPEADWQDLKWGEQRTFSDADHDNVPDRDDWLEHAGLATDPDPTKADTDGDGLSDYAEFMAMNGNAIGHGERLHPALPPVDPSNPDSDGDGIPDGKDPLPWLPMVNYIPPPLDLQHSPWKPCMLRLSETDGAPPLAFILTVDPDKDLGINLAWGDPAADVSDSAIRVSLDLDNDGWFNGDDNYRIELDGSGITRCVQNNAASDTVWPTETPVDNAVAGYTATAVPAGYRHGYTLRLERGKVTGLQAKPGERIGINIGVRPQGEQWYYTFAEPNSLLPLTLR